MTRYFYDTEGDRPVMNRLLPSPTASPSERATGRALLAFTIATAVVFAVSAIVSYTAHGTLVTAATQVAATAFSITWVGYGTYLVLARRDDARRRSAFADAVAKLAETRGARTALPLPDQPTTAAAGTFDERELRFLRSHTETLQTAIERAFAVLPDDLDAADDSLAAHIQAALERDR